MSVNYSLDRVLSFSHGVAVVVGLCLLLSPVNAAYAVNIDQAQKQVVCKMFGLYKICGNINVLYKLEKDFGGLMNFGKAERVAYTKTSAAIRQQDPAAIIYEADSHYPILLEWRTKTRSMLDSLSYDLLSISQYRHMGQFNPVFAAMYHVVKNNQVIISVNLDNYPDFFTVHKNTATRACEETYNDWADFRAYTPEQYKQVIFECYKKVTLGISDLDIRGPDYIKKAFYMSMVSSWGAMMIADRLRAYFEARPRKVYLVKSTRNISPRIDSMGTLYIPDNISDRYSKEDLQLILAHELQHIRLFTFETLIKMMMSSISDITVDKKSGEKFAPDKQVRFQLYKYRMDHELQIDHVLIIKLFKDRDSRYRYQKLIDRIESLYPERVAMIQCLNEIADKSETVKSLKLMAFLFLPDFKSNISYTQMNFTAETLRLVKKYASLRARYLSSAAASYVVEKSNQRVDPMELEDQIFSSNKKLIAEFEKRLDEMKTVN